MVRLGVFLVGLAVCWFCVGDGWLVSGSVDSGCYKLSENVWFVIQTRSYKLYGLKHHIVELISGDVTNAGRRTTTSQDRATQLLMCGKLSLAINWTGTWYIKERTLCDQICASQSVANYVGTRNTLMFASCQVSDNVDNEECNALTSQCNV